MKKGKAGLVIPVLKCSDKRDLRVQKAMVYS